MTTKVEAKFDELKGITGLGEYATILYLLSARIASGLENKEEGSDQIPKSVGQVWNEAASYIEILAQENPHQALKLALTLCLLPKSSDPNQEIIFRWMRGDGPLLLAKKSVKEPLLDFLKSDLGAADLISTLTGYINFDISPLTRDEVFYEPNCFLAVATMFLGTKLTGDTDNRFAASLSSAATEKLKSSPVSQVVRYYGEFEDTAWIAQELEPFLTP